MDINSLLYIVVFVSIAYAVKTYILPEPEVKKPKVVTKPKVAKSTKGGKNADGSQAYYTAEQVSVHDKEDDLWLIIDNKVYDVTEYVDKHMGGLAIMNNAGKDSTKGFNGDQHPIKVRQILEEFYIGDLKQ